MPLRFHFSETSTKFLDGDYCSCGLWSRIYTAMNGLLERKESKTKTQTIKKHVLNAIVFNNSCTGL